MSGGPVQKIVISAAVKRVAVDNEGEGTIAFSIPQEDAAKMLVLGMMTMVPLRLTIEELKPDNLGGKRS